jgi:ABC-type Mn2+/Zn2+ transport system ATPase subunit
VYLCTVLELHHVTIGDRLRDVSLTVGEGQVLTVTGTPGAGKTTLLRAVLGFIPVDSGHISIDGELLTPRSAPWFRRQTAYVPQQLTVPEGYNKLGDGRWSEMTATERYLWLLRKAVASGKSLLVVDEPPQGVTDDEMATIGRLLQDAATKGAAVLAIINKSQISNLKSQIKHVTLSNIIDSSPGGVERPVRLETRDTHLP